MAQIIRITSEALQATIRRLLPSQQGFGEDLQASNVIQPIIDLTPSAEGSELRADLQKAIDKTETQTIADNTTVTVLSSTGFIRVNYKAFNFTNLNQSFTFDIYDGATANIVLAATLPAATGQFERDLIFFVPSGSILRCNSLAASMEVVNYARQIADLTGNLNNPFGYVVQ